MCLCSMYCRSVNIWLIQPRPGLKPCCSRIVCSRGVRRRRRIEANNLEIIGIKLTPRWLLQTILLPFLKIGITIDSPQHPGTSSECQISINSCVMAVVRAVPPSLKRAVRSSSGPAALFRCRRLITHRTSS